MLLHIQGADKYERKIAKIFVNYNNVNKIMLEEGYAILSLYEKYESRLEYKLLESLAKENKKGLKFLRPYSDNLPNIREIPVFC